MYIYVVFYMFLPYSFHRSQMSSVSFLGVVMGVVTVVSTTPKRDINKKERSLNLSL